jgi:hypothetical protein
MLLAGASLAVLAFIAGLVRAIHGADGSHIASEVYWAGVFSLIVVGALIIIFAPSDRRTERRVELGPVVTEPTPQRPSASTRKTAKRTSPASEPSSSPSSASAASAASSTSSTSSASSSLPSSPSATPGAAYSHAASAHDRQNTPRAASADGYPARAPGMPQPGPARAGPATYSAPGHGSSASNNPSPTGTDGATLPKEDAGEPGLAPPPPSLKSDPSNKYGNGDRHDRHDNGSQGNSHPEHGDDGSSSQGVGSHAPPSLQRRDPGLDSNREPQGASSSGRDPVPREQVSGRSRLSFEEPAPPSLARAPQDRAPLDPVGHSSSEAATQDRLVRRREELEARLESLEQRANGAKVSLGLGRISNAGYMQYVKEVDRERTLIEAELMALKDMD